MGPHVGEVDLPRSVMGCFWDSLSGYLELLHVIDRLLDLLCVVVCLALVVSMKKHLSSWILDFLLTLQLFVCHEDFLCLSCYISVITVEFSPCFIY